MSQSLNIVVLVKQVPDSGAPRALSVVDATVDRESGDAVVNEMDEYAIEEALRLTKGHGGQVTLLTMGPELAVQSIRKALQLGADAAIHVTDGALHGSCAVKTSLVLAAALRTLEWDLVICGAESTDGQLAVLPAMLSQRLGVPALTGARKLTIEQAERSEPVACIERQTETGYQLVQAGLPAVVSVWDTINEPHYPNFRDIMAAKSKPITTLSLADLGVSESEVGAAGATSRVDGVLPRPPRQAGVTIDADEQAGAKLVTFLIDRKLV
ncbi:MAG: electron transfer flavoprotein subunit beta/FixA family protein [Mycobacteriales bacterium]